MQSGDTTVLTRGGDHRKEPKALARSSDQAESGFPDYYAAVFKLLIHLSTSNACGHQRDALLYLALGDHLDWGCASVPPLIGLGGSCSQD